MLYYLHKLSELDGYFAIFNVFKYVTVRAAMASATAFLTMLVLGPAFIRFLQRRRVHENIDKPDSDKLHELSQDKHGTPTMGGLLILTALIGSCLLWTVPTNGYVWLTLAVVLALGALGFHDDYVKLTRPGVQGLSIRHKLLWQGGIAFAAAVAVMWVSDPALRGVVTVPLFKPEIFAVSLGVMFVPFAMLVVVGSSNAVNLTDGMDGLAGGCSLLVALTYGGLAYVAGHAQFAGYLNIPMVAGSEELVILCAAAAGALLGFLWFNSHPAQMFMGDTGSLPLGGLIAMVALIVKQELLLVLVGGIFVAEALSVLLQVLSFKLFKTRIFRIAPLHHHFQFGGVPENKIVTRFWIVGFLLALAGVCTLKLR
jgi:phospho-N-acetylmuramoyl-pentapeptide-transferase